MIEEKRLRESKSRVTKYLQEGNLLTKQESEFVDFFLSNAEKSLNSANALFDLSTSKSLQEQTGYVDFDGFLWVVNASYYSMFYMARALLEFEGIKIKSDLSVHLVTFDTLIALFYLNAKLQKRIIEDFIDANEDASELLGKQKTDKLIEDYYWEKGKRATFTYNTREVVLRAKAKTSLQRARVFIEELKKILKK